MKIAFASCTSLPKSKADERSSPPEQVPEDLQQAASILIRAGQHSPVHWLLAGIDGYVDLAILDHSGIRSLAVTGPG
jgi:hypothetical protein